MASLPSAIPVTVDIFFTLEHHPRVEKTSTVTRMATLPSAIPVTVDIFEFRTASESRKTSTGTRMATLTPAIPVTVDTFRIQNPQNDDSYTETRGRGRANPSKKKKWSQPFEKRKPLHPVPYMSVLPRVMFLLSARGCRKVEMMPYSPRPVRPPPKVDSES